MFYLLPIFIDQGRKIIKILSPIKKYGNCKRDPLKWRDHEPEPQKSGGSATQRHLKVSKLPRFVLWPH